MWQDGYLYHQCNNAGHLTQQSLLDPIVVFDVVLQCNQRTITHEIINIGLLQMEDEIDLIDTIIQP